MLTAYPHFQKNPSTTSNQPKPQPQPCPQNSISRRENHRLNKFHPNNKFPKQSLLIYALNKPDLAVESTGTQPRGSRYM